MHRQVQMAQGPRWRRCAACKAAATAAARTEQWHFRTPAAAAGRRISSDFGCATLVEHGQGPRPCGCCDALQRTGLRSACRSCTKRQRITLRLSGVLCRFGTGVQRAASLGMHAQLVVCHVLPMGFTVLAASRFASRHLICTSFTGCTAETAACTAALAGSDITAAVCWTAISPRRQLVGAKAQRCRQHKQQQQHGCGPWATA